MFSGQSVIEDIHAIISENSELLEIELPEKYNKYICSISTFIMLNPVSAQPCGHNFESALMEKWKEQKKTEGETCHCPLCRKEIKAVVENHALRKEIREFLMDTRQKLNREEKKSDSSSFDDPKSVENREKVAQECSGLIDNFLQAGNNEVVLQTKFDKFCSVLAEAAEASKEVSEESSRRCNIL